MSEEEFHSQLPSPKGSPFKTKNFNKFFFGILIAALVLAALILAYFVAGVGKQNQAHPVSTVNVPGSQLYARKEARHS